MQVIKSNLTSLRFSQIPHSQIPHWFLKKIGMRGLINRDLPKKKLVCVS